MRLKIYLLILLLTLTTSLSAQQYKQDYIITKNAIPEEDQIKTIYGVMVGATVPRMSDKAGVIDVKNTAGFNVGMMWGIDFGGLEIVPEIWYQHDKSTIKNTSNGVTGDLKNHSIEVPIIFGIELGPVRFNMGPSFSLMSNSKLYVEDEDEIDFGRVKSTVGYLFGLSTTLWDHMVLDLRYTGRFVSTSNAWYDGYNNDEHYDYRYYSFGFNIGYRF